MIYWCQSATSKRFKNSGEDLKDLFSWIKHFAGRKTKLPVVDMRVTMTDGCICVPEVIVSAPLWMGLYVCTICLCGGNVVCGAPRALCGLMREENIILQKKHGKWWVMFACDTLTCFLILFCCTLFCVFVVVLCYGHWQRYLLEMQLLPVKPEVPICLSVCAPLCVCVRSTSAYRLTQMCVCALKRRRSHTCFAICFYCSLKLPCS